MTDEEAILAGELALGLLEGTDRASALRLVIADPAFAREVERWRQRFGALYGEWPEGDAGATGDRQAPTLELASSPRGDWWRWVAAISSVAAAVLLVLLVARPTPTPTPVKITPPARSVPLLVAVLQPKDGQPFGAVYSPQGNEVRLAGTVATPPDRDLELWAIGTDGVPHAAGLLPRSAFGRLMPRPGTLIAAGVTLALSIEPVGGSPKSTPTGPVVATGKLVAI